MTAPFLEIISLAKDYKQPRGRVRALSLEYLSAERGEAIAVSGPSGSGKTTLLHIIAALIRPTDGRVMVEGRGISAPEKSCKWRASSVGYIFQDVNLLPDFDVTENLLIAADAAGVPESEARARAAGLLRRLGIDDRASHRPAKLSLGERQRAAAARAVIHKPPIVLADEPTASLDAENAKKVTAMLLELCAETNSLLIAATHDEAVRREFPRAIELRKSQGDAQ